MFIDSELTLEDVILRAIASQKNQWVDRTQIARIIGRKRLNYYDIQLLDKLVNEGHIMQKEVKAKYAIVKTKIVYTAK